MRILFVYDEVRYEAACDGSAPERGRSFFFKPGLPGLAEAGVWDIIVSPARFILEHMPAVLPAPIIAFGTDDMLDLCLDAGCADYLREPWRTDELIARASLRSLKSVCLAGRSLLLRHSYVEGPLGTTRLARAGYSALLLLAVNLNREVSRSALAGVTGLSSSSGRALDMTVSRLRKALGRVAGAESAACLISCRAAPSKAGAYALLSH